MIFYLKESHNGEEQTASYRETLSNKNYIELAATPRRCDVTVASYLTFNTRSKSKRGHFVKYASRSREATFMLRRRGVAASIY